MFTIIKRNNKPIYRYNNYYLSKKSREFKSGMFVRLLVILIEGDKATKMANCN